MLLYDGARPQPRAVRMYSAEKHLVIPMRGMNGDGGENRRPEFVVRNPAGKIPVLELNDGSRIAETGAVFRIWKKSIPSRPCILAHGKRESVTESPCKHIYRFHENWTCRRTYGGNPTALAPMR